MPAAGGGLNGESNMNDEIKARSPQTSRAAFTILALVQATLVFLLSL